MLDPSFIADIRAQVSIAAVIAQFVDVQRSGNQLMARCPFHADRTPSMSISDDAGLYNCFGCGAAGDVFDFVMRLEGINFSQALEMVAKADFSLRAIREPSKPTKAGTEKAAKNIWNKAGPIRGTAAEKYLVDERGIAASSLPDASVLRFARLPFERGEYLHHTLVASVKDCAGNITGIHRTYLTSDGKKLPVAASKSAKMALGSIKGNSIHLGPNAEELFLCEGLEDGLSIRQLLPNASVRVAAGAGMLKGMLLPPGCSSIVIAGDNDDAGRPAAVKAADVFRSQGKTVRVWLPEAPFKDFNDYAREVA